MQTNSQPNHSLFPQIPSHSFFLRSFKPPFFSPDGEEGTGGGGETPPPEKKDEGKKDEAPKRRMVVDGETIELTEEQFQRAAFLGIKAAQEKAAQKEEAEKKAKEEESKKTSPTQPTVNDETVKRIEKLEQELARANDEKKVAVLQAKIETALSKAGIDPDFLEMVQSGIINKFALAHKNKDRTGQEPDLDAICTNEIAAYKKKMEKYERKIDPEEKKKDRDKTKGLASRGATPSQEGRKVFDRFAFRNPEFRKSIQERAKQMLKGE